MNRLSTPEKKSERSRKKSKQQTPGLEGQGGTPTSESAPAPILTLNSVPDEFLEGLCKSGHVPLFDFSKTFQDPDYEMYLSRSFLGIDAVRWAMKYVPGGRSQDLGY